MRIDDLFALMENDGEHSEALRKTGMWGKQAAGCLILARSTGRFLIAHRSWDVQEPGYWGIWGGAIDRGLRPDEGARLEVAQETGYRLAGKLIPLYIYRKKVPGGIFRYFNFLAVVDDEFRPILNWENQGYRWCKYGEWPTPTHFGLTALTNDPASHRKVQAELDKLGS